MREQLTTALERLAMRKSTSSRASSSNGSVNRGHGSVDYDMRSHEYSYPNAEEYYEDDDDYEEDYEDHVDDDKFSYQASARSSTCHTAPPMRTCTAKHTHERHAHTKR